MATPPGPAADRSAAYGPPADADELARYAEIISESFNLPLEQPRGRWLDRLDHGCIRVARSGGRVVGGLYLVECGQFFGGRAVPMVGISAVVVAPEARGAGVGTSMTRSAMRELAARGVPISSLYPATQPVYRRAGFEQAGDYVGYRVPIAAIPRGPRDLAVERFEPDGPGVRAELDALHRRLAVHQPGALERNDFLWRRLIDPLGFRAGLFRVREDGVTTGYVALEQRERPRGPGMHFFDLHCRPLEAETPTALARLLTFIADYDSLCDTLVVCGPPRMPALAALGELRPEVYVATRWMLRVVDVVAALVARGYPRGMCATFEFTLDDPLLVAQRGRYRLAVDGGRGVVERSAAAAGGVSLTERGLAALFAGYLSAEELVPLGLAAGAPDDLATASAVFAGPAPWLGEIF